MWLELDQLEQGAKSSGVEKWELLSRVQLFVTPWNYPGQNIGVANVSLLQGIFPTQGLNPGPPHCRQEA